MLLRAVEVGNSPPGWEDAPLSLKPIWPRWNRLDDDALWSIARSRQTEQKIWCTMAPSCLPKERRRRWTLERAELKTLRTEADRFMLRKAQAVMAILRWRGHLLPPSGQF